MKWKRWFHLKVLFYCFSLSFFLVSLERVCGFLVLGLQKPKNKTLRWNHLFPFKRCFLFFLFQCYFLKSGNFACFVTKSQPDERVVCNDNAWIAELNAVGNDVQTESFSDGRGSLDRWIWQRVGWCSLLSNDFLHVCICYILIICVVVNKILINIYCLKM